jgi:phosphoglycerate dehydrogenase-like enzyme
MQVMISKRNPPVDITSLRKRFPDVTFAEFEGPEEARKVIGESEVLVTYTGGYTKAFADVVNNGAGKRLKWIHFTTSGIDAPLALGGFPKGVMVTNSAGLRGNNVSDHAFAMLLFLARGLRKIEAARLKREWVRDQMWGQIRGLETLTLTIMGLGAIGQAAARKAKAFDMNVVAISKGYKPDHLVDEVYPYERMKEALAKADAFLISAPSDARTRGIIDADKLGAMKKTAFLLNIARGDIVVEKDLVAACRNGTIAGAGIDTTDPEPLPAASELWQLDNVLITPHVGGAGAHSNEPMLKIFADNLDLYRKGKPLNNQLDWEAMLG